jgi:hypothetical protein
MNRKVKHSDGSLYSPWQVLGAANSYYALSCIVTDTIQDEESIAANPPDSDAIAASATNRILALELYLKALLVGYNLPVPWHHDLLLLYESVPQVAQHAIRLQFDEKNDIEYVDGKPIELLVCFQLAKSLSEKDWRKRAYASSPKDTSLVGVLERNKDGFALSRYLFQQAKFDQETVFWYEHWRLSIVCSAICELLENALQNRSLSYKRPFNF